MVGDQPLACLDDPASVLAAHGAGMEKCPGLLFKMFSLIVDTFCTLV